MHPVLQDFKSITENYSLLFSLMLQVFEKFKYNESLSKANFKILSKMNCSMLKITYFSLETQLYLVSTKEKKVADRLLRNKVVINISEVKHPI